MDNEDILLEELLSIEQQLKISCCDDVQLKSEELPNEDKENYNEKELKVIEYLNAIDDEDFPSFYPEENDVERAEEVKFIFGVATAFARRALMNRRGKKRKKRRYKGVEGVEEKALPCWEGYVQVGMKKGKNGKMVPNCVPIEKKTETDETEISEKSEKQKIRDPKGGLTAAGRAYFKRTEGANLKPGVKGAANTPEKMRRKGSFLTRFFTNPSGPLVDEKGRATRLALSAAAWGERVPKNVEDAARLAEKGRNLLERYKNMKEKSSEFELEIKNLGQSIGQMVGTSPSTDEAIDRDGDGFINDGTDQEQRAPYKKQSNTGYEKARRKFVRSELARQGIKRNAKVQNRSKIERDARARARAKYDQMTRAAGEEKQNEIDKARKKTPATTNPKPADRYPNPSSDRSRKPADRYPNPPDADRGRKPADRYPNPEKKYPPGQKPRRPLKPAGTGRNFSERRPTTLEERDKNRGSGQKPSTLEQRDKNKGPSGPIVPRSV